MDGLTLLERLKNNRIVPVVKLDRVEDALPLAEALLEGGLPTAEITFRTEAAEDSIRSISARYPEMIVGAGTVINVEQAKRATDAGATFLVSPGFSPEVVEFALQKNMAIVPGCCTPTEIMAAMTYGLHLLKFFPANLFGGLNGIKALAPVFPAVRFMPTGGVSATNVLEYLSYEPVLAVGGTWMVKDALIRAGSFDQITSLTKEAVALIS